MYVFDTNHHYSMVGIFLRINGGDEHVHSRNLMDDENVCMIKRNYSGKLEIIELATFQISKIKKYMEHKDVAFVIVKDDEKGA